MEKKMETILLWNLRTLVGIFLLANLLDLLNSYKQA